MKETKEKAPVWRTNLPNTPLHAVLRQAGDGVGITIPLLCESAGKRLAEEIQRLAWAATEGRIRAALPSAIGVLKHADLLSKLTEAEADKAAWERKLARLEIDRADVVATLSGEQLAIALAKIDADKTASRQHLELMGRGIANFKADVESAWNQARTELGRVADKAQAETVAALQQQQREAWEAIPLKIRDELDRFVAATRALLLLQDQAAARDRASSILAAERPNLLKQAAATKTR